MGVPRLVVGVARLAWWRISRPESVTVVAAHRHLSITLRYPDQLMPTLAVFGDLLEPELGLLAESLPPGTIAVDVGASVGTWAMVAARAGATVLAYEPDPLNIEVLQHNLLVNGLDKRVRVLNSAVGRRAGSGTLQRSARSYLNRVEECGTAGSGQAVTMTTVTEVLDDNGVDHVSVLKVNTAGRESDVLEGALSAFRQRRVGLALFLDGIAVRSAVAAAMAEGHLDDYRLAAYDGQCRALRYFDDVTAYAACRLSPMNRYLILARRDTGGAGA